MGAYSELNRVSSEMAKDICHDNPNYTKTVNKIASKTVEYAVTTKTGSDYLGKAAGYATNEFSKSNDNYVAETVTSLGVGVAITAASIVAAPVLIVAGIWDSIFGD